MHPLFVEQQGVIALVSHNFGSKKIHHSHYFFVDYHFLAINNINVRVNYVLTINCQNNLLRFDNLYYS